MNLNPFSQTIKNICQAYYAKHAQEKNRGQDFLDFLNEEQEFFSRNNFKGHITVSSFVLDVSQQSVLLIYHKQLQRYLQPGGHFERDAALSQGALREVFEEVGIASEQLVNLDDTLIPFDIDLHCIPFNAKKMEPEHFHFDCRYIFALKSDVKVTLAENEVEGYKWVSLDDAQLPDYLGILVVKKLRTFWQEKS